MACAVVTPQMSYAQSTAVSNAAQTFSNYTGPANNGSGNVIADAMSFTTGSTSYTFTSISIQGFGYGSGPTGFTMALYTGIGAGGPTGLVTNLSGSSTLPSAGTYTYTPVTPTTLLASTTYWWVSSAPTTPSSSGFSLNATASASEDGGALAGWSIGDTRWVTTDGGTSWTTSSPLLQQFTVTVTAIPEPVSAAGLAGGCALALALWRRRRAQRKAN
jgi:hypothetical protein